MRERGELEVRNGGRQQAPEALGGFLGFEDAALAGTAAFYANAGAFRRNSIGHAGAVVGGERIEGPIGIADDANTPFGADQDGDFRWCVADPLASFGTLQNIEGVLHEPAHEILIAQVEEILNWAQGYSGLG